ncbi:hypothetical protein LPJ72_003790 [Coemansia sp. Benny D160-2]|nr:hypothetical protein LPJ72_003790 [Coemansia sp. Benny D160-2]
MTRSSTRAQKKVNYFEEHADDSEESDFEVSDDETIQLKKKTRADAPAKSGRSSTTASKHAKKEAQKSVSESKERNNDDEPSVEKEDTLILGSSPSDAATSAAAEGPETADNGCESSPEDQHKESVEKPSGRKRARDSDDDGFDSQESDSDFDADDDEDDDEDDGFFVDIKPGKSKGGAAAKKTSAATKQAAATKTKTAAAASPAKQLARGAKKPVALKRTPKAADKPLVHSGVQKQAARAALAGTAAKRIGSNSTPLGSLLSSPRSAKSQTPRPSLLSASSSSRSSLSSTSLSLSPLGAQKRKPMVGTKPGTSLRDILSSSSAPRAGLRRGVKRAA